ncbi:MAG: arylsulfatase, partial [Alphaproteobacteria bacterium]|nr:arylsulfatase [Alphaproteobacteria bacterium]
MMRQGYLKRVRARLAKDMARVIAAGLVASLSGQALAQAGGDAASAQQQQQPLRTQADGSWRYYPNIPKAPKGAPNVLLVLTDDVGFGASSTFGGPIPTPNFDMLARNGLKYTQFHTTAMCSPTRASLLTGRNHHAVGSGSISNVSVDEPGYTSVIPDSAATLGQVLKNNGYDTAWFGKNHNTPDWELGPMGPFTHWPSGMGFDYFYGFNAAGTDQANPPLLENHIGVRRDPNDPNYIFEKDMADHLLAWMSAQNGSNPDKPFFAYYAPGAMHGPQQAPKEWIDKFKGKFDMGWDVVREQILARQKKMGVVAPDTKLAPPLPGVPAWSSLSSDQKRLYARMMEVAAAQLAYTDDQFGRIIARLKDTGQLDNTLIIFIQGDNGAALHNLRGTNNVYSLFAGIEPSDEDMLKDIDRLGSEHVLSNYPVGWGYATNTPFPWGKTVASKLGGLRDGMVISWPKGIADKGGVRSQFSHVIDIAPTIYEA